MAADTKLWFNAAQGTRVHSDGTSKLGARLINTWSCYAATTPFATVKIRQSLCVVHACIRMAAANVRYTWSEFASPVHLKRMSEPICWQCISAQAFELCLVPGDRSSRGGRSTLALALARRGQWYWLSVASGGGGAGGGLGRMFQCRYTAPRCRRRAPPARAAVLFPLMALHRASQWELSRAGPPFAG